MLKKTSQDEIIDFLSDSANVQGNCDAVYFPETKEEVKEIIDLANKKNIQVTVSGNGTGLTGGRVPKSGIVISTSKLNKIKEINEDEKFAVVEAGVLLEDFHKLLKEKRLYYPPDPTENNCFIGGNIATNASGAKSFKYGPTRDYVLAIEVILPNGKILNIERGKYVAKNFEIDLTEVTGQKLKVPKIKMPETKHAAGYFSKENVDLIDLFIGSEGTLGIVTEAKLKLLHAPENILSSVLFFESETDALNFIDDARKISKNHAKIIDALGLEFFDKNALLFLSEEYPNIPQNITSAVWFEQEFTEENEDKIFDEWMYLIDNHNCDMEKAWFAATDKERQSFLNFRHAVSYKVSEYIAQKNISKVGTDTAVPVKFFRKYYEYCKNKVTENKLHYITYGHAGDCHLHLNMLPENDAEFVKAKELYQDFCRKAVELEGTISAEHGIGKLKTDYLLDMFSSDEINEMIDLKKSLDKNLILNIGNIFKKEMLRNE